MCSESWWFLSVQEYLPSCDEVEERKRTNIVEDCSLECINHLCMINLLPTHKKLSSVLKFNAAKRFSKKVCKVLISHCKLWWNLSDICFVLCLCDSVVARMVHALLSSDYLDRVWLLSKEQEQSKKWNHVCEYHWEFARVELIHVWQSGRWLSYKFTFACGKSDYTLQITAQSYRTMTKVNQISFT